MIYYFTGKIFINSESELRSYRLSCYFRRLEMLTGLFDAFVQRSTKDAKHTRFAPILLHFAVSLMAKSPSAYSMLRQACPLLPCDSTIDAYKYVVRNRTGSRSDVLVTRTRSLMDLHLQPLSGVYRLPRYPSRNITPHPRSGQGDFKRQSSV